MNGSRVLQQLRAAQERYDYMTPDDGECDHHWTCLGSHPDGATFYRCTLCGAENET